MVKFFVWLFSAFMAASMVVIFCAGVSWAITTLGKLLYPDLY